MNKYIDAGRLNMEWQTLKPFGVTDTMIENPKWIVDRHTDNRSQRGAMFHLFETVKPKLKEIKLDSSKRLEDFGLSKFSKKLVKDEDGNIRYRKK